MLGETEIEGSKGTVSCDDVLWMQIFTAKPVARCMIENRINTFFIDAMLHTSANDFLRRCLECLRRQLISQLPRSPTGLDELS